MKPSKAIALFALVFGMLFMHFLTISVLLKNKDNLRDISGVITTKYITQTLGKGNHVAEVLVLNNSAMQFAVQDNNRAFEYVSNNDIVSKPAEVLYDPSGFNSIPNITYHIYYLKIDGNEIMTIAESKSFYKGGLIALILIDLLLIGLYIRARRLNKPFLNLGNAS